ncbi:UNVERIFIED_CONTAM: DNA-damage-repair/toleration protein, chloroplastic [Sesamum latifolium]|uniref:DNA-damage-repair/toleration protein, chloroplastic n=1 Tax=Sesamum latifolium TaxID=2727402 RepID=A0AAW2WKX4_9LAMI
MLGGLYGDLPPPSSATDDSSTTTSATNVWSSSVKMAPPTLRKPLPPSQTILRPPNPKPKQSQITTVSKNTIAIQPPAVDNPNPNPTTSAFQPALVGVTSSVLEEYDPARPNDYEDYRRSERGSKQRQRSGENWRRERGERGKGRRERRERGIAIGIGIGN